MVRAGAATAEPTAIGRRDRLPAPPAALVNGTLAHSLDFDDTHLPSVLHPSASVVPAALAVAEARGATRRAVLDAAGVGDRDHASGSAWRATTSELGNSVFFERGLHATSICGALGAAVGGGDAVRAGRRRHRRRDRRSRRAWAPGCSRPTAPAAR